MKNKLWIIAFTAIIGFSFASCGDGSGGGSDGGGSGGTGGGGGTGSTVAVTGVSLNKTSTTILVNGTEKLTATVAPDNATNKAVTWSTSDPTKATVENGTVTAKAAGTATITVTTADQNKTATCTVTVSATAVAVTGVSLNKTSTSITVGNTELLTATIAPSGATNQNVTWSTSNAAIATVNEGTVTAKAAGSATITVTTADGNKTATCAVTVTAGSTPITTYTVIYNANGGTGTTASSEHTIGTSKALTANGFTKAGNLFVCWTTNEGGTGTRYYNGQSVTDLTTTATTVNLYAQWAEGNMYYGVISSGAISGLINGTSQNPFNSALVNPNTTGANINITTITKPTPSNGKELIFNGSGVRIILVPVVNFGELKAIKDILDRDILSDFTPNPKVKVTIDAIEYHLYTIAQRQVLILS